MTDGSGKSHQEEVTDCPMVCSAIIALDIAMVVSSLAPRNLSVALVTEEHLLVTVPTEALMSASVLGEDWVSKAYRRSVVFSRESKSARTKGAEA